MIYGLIFAAGVLAATVFIQHGSMEDRYAEIHAAHHGNSAHLKGHGEGAHIHDEVNMPGLQGKDITNQEVNDLKEIFRSHQGITREVTTSTEPNTYLTALQAVSERVKARKQAL